MRFGWDVDEFGEVDLFVGDWFRSRSRSRSRRTSWCGGRTAARGQYDGHRGAERRRQTRFDGAAMGFALPGVHLARRSHCHGDPRIGDVDSVDSGGCEQCSCQTWER